MKFEINKIAHHLISKEIKENLKIQDLLITGSNLFGDATQESDYDLVIISHEDDTQNNCMTLEDLGFSCNGTDYEGDGSFWRNSEYQIKGYAGEFNVNIIYTTCPTTFWAWVFCTRAAQRLGLNKEQRVTLFNTFIDEGVSMFRHNSVHNGADYTDPF